MSDFLNGLKIFEDYLKNAAGSVLTNLDKMTYRLLVDCLKGDDPESIKNAIDQLVKEKRSTCIPPIYLVSVAHPVPWVRQQASVALKKIVAPSELEKLTQGKDVQSCVSALIEKYGHYKG